jgi:hypothetical protein
VRYSGVLAPSAGWRDRIVPKAEEEEAGEATAGDCGTVEGKTTKEPRRHPRRYAWAGLLKRVFAVDVLRCDECGGRMRILCAVNPPEAVRKILDCVGLPSRPPPISPAATGYVGADD